MQKVNLCREVLENAIGVHKNCEKCGMELPPLDVVAVQAMEELLKYRDAEEQGLLLRLPVAEGIAVYVNDYTLECKYGYECPLSFDKYKCEADVRCQHEYKKYRVREAKFNHMMLDKIGKTVFLTQEEAEQALKHTENTR